MTKFRIVDKRGGVPAHVEPVEDTIISPTKAAVIPEPPDYDKINLKMCGDRMLLQDFPNSDMVGSIFIPNVGDVAVDRARIVAIGPGCKLRKVGEIIFKMAQLGQTLTTNEGVKYTFMPENAAIAIDADFDGKSMGPIQDDNV